MTHDRLEDHLDDRATRRAPPPFPMTLLLRPHGRVTASRTRTVALLLLGVLAAALYATIVEVAAELTPGYSHVAQPVSSLYQAGAPLGVPIALAFVVYNALVAGFGIGLLAIATDGTARRRADMAAGITIVLVAVAGAIDDVFPQDPIGTAVTTAGTLHIVFAGVASLLTVVAMALAGWWLWAQHARRVLAAYSLASLVLILAFGPLTAAATASASPIMGLLERVTIFTFILWMALTSVVLARVALREGATS
jgi:Protein of unknown function (DUF998)